MVDLVPNRPTDLGRDAGKQVARLWRASMRSALMQAPEAVAAIPDRCRTCAFREGTVPNGCEETVMDAIKCVIEKVPFMCHHDMKNGKPTKMCAGWIVTQRADQAAGKAPWDWTAPKDEPSDG